MEEVPFLIHPMLCDLFYRETEVPLDQLVNLDLRGPL